MATDGRWFATWIQDACSSDMSPACHRAARHPKQPSAISSFATRTDQSMPSCYGLSERLSIPADVGDLPPWALPSPRRRFASARLAAWLVRSHVLSLVFIRAPLVCRAGARAPATARACRSCCPWVWSGAHPAPQGDAGARCLVDAERHSACRRILGQRRSYMNDDAPRRPAWSA